VLFTGANGKIKFDGTPLCKVILGKFLELFEVLSSSFKVI